MKVSSWFVVASLLNAFLIFDLKAQTLRAPHEGDEIGNLIKNMEAAGHPSAQDDQIGELIKSLDTTPQVPQPSAPTVKWIASVSSAGDPTFFWRTTEIATVYKDEGKTQVVYAMKPGEIFPFKGMTNGLAIIQDQQTGESLYVDLGPKFQNAEQVDSKKNPIKVYIDRPKGVVVTLSSEPGKTWRDCEGLPPESSPCIGWPPAGYADIELLDSQLIPSPELGKSGGKQLYYKVRARYLPLDEVRKRTAKGEDVKIKEGDEDGKAVVGWIAAKDIRLNELGQSTLSIPEIAETALPLPLPAIKPDCDCLESQLKAQGENILNLAEQAQSTPVELRDFVGACFGKKKSLGSNPFQKIFRPEWDDYYRTKKPSITYKGKVVDKKALFAIEALARTVFGEMRGCTAKGVRYPAAVARIILNRAHYVKSGKRRLPYVQEAEASIRENNGGRVYTDLSINELIPYVVSSKKQFSSWNPDDKNARLLLCPQNLKGADQKAWDKILEIATRAILEPEKFKDETDNIKEFYFTSGIKPWWVKKEGMSENKTAEVGSLPIDDPSCLRIWVNNESKNYEWVSQLWPFFDTSSENVLASRYSPRQ